MATQVQQLFEDFERYLDNVAKFGQSIANQMADKLNATLRKADNREEAANELLKTYRPSEALINNFIQENDNAQNLNNQLMAVFDEQAANKLPRKQIDTKRQKLVNEINNELAGSNLKSHPFLDKMDKAIRDSIMDIVNSTPANQNIDPQRLTTAFDNVMKTMDEQVRNEYKLRLANRLTPTMRGPRPDDRLR